MQDSFPLCVARRRNIHLGAFAQIDFFPCGPIAVGIVDVAASHHQFHITGTAKVDSSPAGEDLGIENVALVTALALWSRPEHEDLAEIAGCGVEAAARGLGKTSHL